MSRRLLFCMCMSLLLIAPGTPSPLEQHTILVGTIGTDTVAVDRFIRTTMRLEGVVLVRRPQVHTMHYKAMLAPEGRFSHLEIIWRDAKGVELRSASMSFGVDSIRSELKEVRVRSFSAPPVLDAIPIPPQPYAAHAYAILEHAAIVLLMDEKADSAQLQWITAGTTKAEKRRIRRVVGDTIEIDYIAGPVRAHADSARRVLWLSIGNAPTQSIVRRSDKDINIEKLAASFASRDTL